MFFHLDGEKWKIMKSGEKRIERQWSNQKKKSHKKEEVKRRETMRREKKEKKKNITTISGKWKIVFQLGANISKLISQKTW